MRTEQTLIGVTAGHLVKNAIAIREGSCLPRRGVHVGEEGAHAMQLDLRLDGTFWAVTTLVFVDERAANDSSASPYGQRKGLLLISQVSLLKRK